ncbi:tagatose 1,6-diphosphate aldolase [Dehalogenimonas sp. 4OHTPN]|uniref:Tagatose 1,6-diphosphate aldolase n=1 Tax=Dehalogenimonas sp. 4OHTPN TaxID=3166643 RepID=A0AAU8GAK9_9CHLR
MYFSLSPGKARGLRQISGAGGRFTMAAMDHRGSLEHELCAASAQGCYNDMADFKMDLCAALAPHASAVLLDPIFGAAQAISRDVLPKSAGLLVSVEATGYQGDQTARRSRILDGWGVAKIKRLGASAVKMLTYFRPDSGDLAADQLELVAEVAKECQKHDIPFLVEPVSYPLQGESAAAFASKKTSIVVETARLMTGLPIDVLKAEFPADISLNSDDKALTDACRSLDAAASKPWVILSGGASYEVFRRQVEFACRAGASGFLAGRALWQEAVAIGNRIERRRFLETVAARRLMEISSFAETLGQPWYQKIGLAGDQLFDVNAEWYRNY